MTKKDTHKNKDKYEKEMRDMKKQLQIAQKQNNYKLLKNNSTYPLNQENRVKWDNRENQDNQDNQDNQVKWDNTHTHTHNTGQHRQHRQQTTRTTKKQIESLKDIALNIRII